MFFLLSKMLVLLIQPLSYIIGLLLISALAKNDRIKRRSLLVAIAIIFFFTNPFVVNQVLIQFEHPLVTYKSIDDDFDVAVVLGGFTNPSKSPFDRTHFNKGADRLLHALELYKLGKVKKILISGGSSRIIGEKYSEAKNMPSFLINMGVKKNDILIEVNSRNTHENALNTKELIDKIYPNGAKVLLVTSAFHMTRSIGCFEKQAFNFIPFPTDSYANEFYWSPSTTIIPSANALNYWNMIIKEWVGILAYKISGYI